MNKSLDEIKEELANEFYISYPVGPLTTFGCLRAGFTSGFTACQSLSIDRREVKLLVEALDKAAKQVTWVDQKNQKVILTYGFHIESCQMALEAFYKKHPEMKEGE